MKKLFLLSLLLFSLTFFSAGTFATDSKGFRIKPYAIVSPPEVPESYQTTVQEYHAKIKEALLSQDFATAFDILNLEEALYKKEENTKGQFWIATMRSAIYEWQGKPQEAVAILENLPLDAEKTYNGMLTLLLGTICLRTGQYELAAESMTRQINKINKELILADQQSDKEWESTLHFMLSVCYYHRSVARCFLRIGKEDIKMEEEGFLIIKDLASSLVEIEKVDDFISVLMAQFYYRNYRKGLEQGLFRSITLSFSKQAQKGLSFLVTPHENQIPFVELDQDDKPISINLFFTLDLTVCEL